MAGLTLLSKLWRVQRVLERYGTALGLGSIPIVGNLLRKLVFLARGKFFAPQRPPDFIQMRGFSIRWPPEDKSAYFVEALYDDFEPETTRLFEKLVQPGMTVVDVGAHIGYYTLLSARLVGNSGSVCAFEPCPATHHLLLENIDRNGFNNVRCMPLAVSDRDGEVHLFVSAVNTGAHSIYGGAAGTSNSVTVQCTTLDSFFSEEGWPPVDLVKVDVEGAEKAVFDGMRELSQRNPGLRVIWEFNPRCQRVAGIKGEDLFASLQELGFSRFRIVDRRLDPIGIPEHIAKLMLGGVVNVLAERS